MQAPDSAVECLDPALMSAFEDGAVDPFGQWHCPDADAGPPSPFDMSTIDPDLLALYPEKNGSVDVPAASAPLIPVDVEAEDLSLSLPPLQDEPSAISTSTEDTESTTHDQLPPAKSVRFAPLQPHDLPEPKHQVSHAQNAAPRAHNPENALSASPHPPPKNTPPSAPQNAQSATARSSLPPDHARAASGRRKNV